MEGMVLPWCTSEVFFSTIKAGKVASRHLLLLNLSEKCMHVCENILIDIFYQLASNLDDRPFFRIYFFIINLKIISQLFNVQKAADIKALYNTYNTENQSNLKTLIRPQKIVHLI